MELSYYPAFTYFFIHTIGGIIQNLHPFATASQHLHPSTTTFTNNGYTTRGTSRLCAFSPGIWHDSFPCPQLLSAPIFSVVPSFFNYSTYASDLGGGTQTQPKTATQPQAITQPQASTQPQAITQPQLQLTQAKSDKFKTQIVMQMTYPTMQSAPQAVTIQSAPNSIKKCMSKYDLHLFRFDFHIIFGYLQIAHNNQIDSQEQIEVKEAKIQDIKFKDKKDEQDIQEEAKA